MGILIHVIKSLVTCACWDVMSRKKHFFDWFNEHITHPTIQSIRKRYNPLSTSNLEAGEIPIAPEVCIWGDSDIPYLQQMTSPERIKLSISRGVFFSKIGAQITEMSQPLDLSPFFKFKKKSGGNDIS